MENPKKKIIINGRYDFNLAEFPLCIFSRRNKEKQKSLEYTDTIKGRGGKDVQRKWTVTWDSKYGPPTASTNNVFYELFQIWNEDRFRSQKIIFHSAYNLLKRMGKIDKKKKQGKAQRMEIWKDIKILRGVMIEAHNAFWDNERKLYVHKNFNLFDEFETYDDELVGAKPAKEQQNLFPSWIKASDVLYQSVKSNSQFDTQYSKEFYYSLTPIEQRLFMYFQKMFKFKNSYQRNLFKFASQIPILSENVDKIKQTIRINCHGLREKGYKHLKEFYFEKNEKGETNFCFKKNGKARSKSAKIPEQLISKRSQQEIHDLAERMMRECRDEKSKNWFIKVAASDMPEWRIISALGDVKVAMLSGQIKKSPGAMFTHLMKEAAKSEAITI